jgi:hypothetical protein
MNLDTYTFANNETGEAQRASLARMMSEAGRNVELGEEQSVVTLLTLKVGPRPESGEIAKAMKARRDG